MPELFEHQCELNMDAIRLQFEIDYSKMLMEFTYDSDILDGSYYSEASNGNTGNEKATPSKFATFVNNLITRLKRLASDIFEMITSAFSMKKQERVGVKEFQNSSTGQREMEKLYREIDAKANAIYAEGNNLISRIMSKAGCPPEMIHTFSKKVANVSNFFKTHKKAIKVGAVSAATLGAIRLAVKTKNDTIEMAGKAALEAEGSGVERQPDLTEVLNGMSKIFYDFTGVLDYAKTIKN